MSSRRTSCCGYGCTWAELISDDCADGAHATPGARSQCRLMATLADLHQLSSTIISRIHGAADCLSADRTDMQTGMTVKSAIRMSCVRLIHRQSAFFADNKVFMSARQFMPILIWISAAHAKRMCAYFKSIVISGSFSISKF